MVIYSIAIIVTTFTNITRLTSGVRDIILYPSQADKTKSRGWVLLTDWVFFKPTVNVASYPCSFFVFYFSLWYLKYSWQIQPQEWTKTSNVWSSLFISIFFIWSNRLCWHFCGVQESSKSHHDDDHFAGICLSNTRVTELRLWLGRNLFKAAFFSLGKRSARFEQEFWSCWALQQKTYFYYILRIKIWYTKISNWLEVEKKLSWSANYYYFQVDWAEPEHEVDEETMSTVKVKSSRFFYIFITSYFVTFNHGRYTFAKKKVIIPIFLFQILFVRNLMLSTTETTLRELFNRLGNNAVKIFAQWPIFRE